MYVENESSINLMKLNQIRLDLEHSMRPTLWRPIKRVAGIAKEIVLLPRNGLMKTGIKIASRINPMFMKDYTLTYSHESSEINYVSTGKEISGKIAVYTSVFGNYDKIQDPLYISEYCDYYAITDQKLSNNSVWKKYDDSRIPGFANLDNYHKAKYCKMFPHILFPDYDYSIWIDGNILIVADLYPLVDRMTNSYIAMFNNPIHNCIYTEKKFVIYYDYVKNSDITNQINTYKSEGMPAHFGMRECSIIVRQHSNIACQKLMNEWWIQVNKFTMRDQISLPYVIWKNNMTIEDIQLLGDTWRWNLRFVQLKHNNHITYK